MDITSLKEIIIDQKDIYVPSSKIVQRHSFAIVDQLVSNRLISIITGLRRCGKSVFLHYIRQQLPKNDFFLNFEDDRLAMFTVDDFQDLFLAFLELYNEQNDFFFDEIQVIPEWERFVRRLHNQGYKVFITGSNANLLSKELGTKLTGRYLDYAMYPCSFREFLQFKKIKVAAATSTLTKDDNSTIFLDRLGSIDIAKLRQYFQEYCLMGGLPEYYEINNISYLHTLYENILYKDVVSRYNISNVSTIKKLVYYLASNIAKETSFNNIKNILGLGATSTISDYCEYLENSYLCYFIPRYSPSLKKQYGYNKKVYFIDVALARAVGFRTSEDYGRLLENIVFLELKRHHKHIYFYSENNECDFIIKEENKITHAFQVCVTLQNGKTYKREVAGIKNAMQDYKLDKGFIITENEQQTIEVEINGHMKSIDVIPIWKWLLIYESHIPRGK